jgi:uncharacterized membrane protein YkvA (DUF1232 family)
MKKIFLWQLIKSTPISAWRYAVTRVRLYAQVFRSPATPLHVKALMVLATAYLLSPIDLIPDYVPILGLIDDFALLGLILSYADGYITDEMRARINDIDM